MDDRISLAPGLDRYVAVCLTKAPDKKAAFPIALGDYEDPGGEIARARARQLFWQAFAEEAPDALRELFDEAAVRSAQEQGTLDDWVLQHFGAWWRRYGLEDERFAFPDDVADWRRQYPLGRGALHAVVTFARSVANPHSSVPPLARTDVESVFAAYQRHSHAPMLIDRYGVYHFDIDDPLDIELTDDDGTSIMGWNPVFETRTDAETRHRALFEHQLKAAMDKREREVQARGLIPTRHTKRTAEHFRWLVRYQCRGVELATIARDVGKTPTAIQRGIREAAALIGITVRAPAQHGGRPRNPPRHRANTVIRLPQPSTLAETA